MAWLPDDEKISKISYCIASLGKNDVSITLIVKNQLSIFTTSDDEK